MHVGFWLAITRRESPPSLLARQLSLAASECGLSLGARNPDARQHPRTGHWFSSLRRGNDLSVIGILVALVVIAIVLTLFGGWIFGIPLAVVAIVLFVLFLMGWGRRATAGGP
jgi:hypothetical protein